VLEISVGILKLDQSLMDQNHLQQIKNEIIK